MRCRINCLEMKGQQGFGRDLRRGEIFCLLGRKDKQIKKISGTKEAVYRSLSSNWRWGSPTASIKART